MKQTEKKARQTSRVTRKKTRLTRRAITSSTAALIDSARYITDPLEMTDYVSADFVNEEVSVHKVGSEGESTDAKR